MAIASDNTIQTNYRTELVALRAAETAPYFTVGSKAYIPDSCFCFIARDISAFCIMSRFFNCMWEIVLLGFYSKITTSPYIY